MKQGQSITIDELAGMMKTSFDHLEKKIDDTKDELKADIADVKGDIKEVKERLDNVENRLEQIENKVENRHETRLTKLEDDMRIVKTALGK